jgi:hypothetical protein
MEFVRAFGGDGDAVLDVFTAWVAHEIAYEDFLALLSELCDGTYEVAALERRKLLALARQALAGR